VRGAADAHAVDPFAWKAGEIPAAVADGPSTSLTWLPAPHRWATRGVFGRRSWKKLLQAAAQPELWPGAGNPDTASLRLPAWTFAQYRDDTRVVTRDVELSARETRARVEAVHGLMIEYLDEPAVDGEHLRRWWGDHAFVAYTSGHHEQPMGDRPPGPRWRVMVPLAKPVDLATAMVLGAWARHPRHDAGIIAPITEDAWRVVPSPAIGPGGYRWLARSGALLDPDEALAQLATWRVLDTRVRAEQALEGTSLATAADAFEARRARPERHPVFPIPVAPLAELLPGLWPGRLVAVLGSGGSGKTTLALQIASAAAGRGQPVLLVLTRMGGDEAVARLLAQRTGIPPRRLLSGDGAIDEALAELRQAAQTLHLWAPVADERSLDHLVAKVRATSDAHDGHPPLVVVDGIEGWGVDDPARGARQLVAGLRDAAHTGTLAPDWPGAGVLLVGALPGPSVAPTELEDQARSGSLDLGGIEHEAGAVVVLATEGEQARVVVAKNRDGPTGSASLQFLADRACFR